MSQFSGPASSRKLLRVLREFAAGRETSAGLDADPADCAADLVALAESLAVLTSALAAAVVRYDRLDAGSPAAVLVQDGHLTRTEAANLRELGRKLEKELPATRESLADGRMGVAQAKTIADLDNRLAESAEPVPAEARRQVEAALAEYAASATTTETAHAARNARYRIDAETVEREMRGRRDERGITISGTLDGTRHLDGLLDPVSASIWDGFVDRTAAPAAPGDTRTAAARRLDAITDALELHQRISAGIPDGPRLQESCGDQPAGNPYRRPTARETGEDPAIWRQGKSFAWRKTSPAHLMVIASHDLLAGNPGAEPATLGDGTIIPAETARRYMCEAALNRVLLATEKEPLELGRTTRLFTPIQVKAMITRDRTCQWRGCEVPAMRCTPHHTVPWSRGGESNTGNGIMLCPVHHRMSHEDAPCAKATGPPGQEHLRAA